MAFLFSASAPLAHCVSVSVAVPAKVGSTSSFLNRRQRLVISCAEAKSKRSGVKKGSGGGLLQPVPISTAMQKFLGVPESSRTDALKKIWAYIKQNGLQDPSNKREIVCDDTLKSIFDGRDRVGFLEVAGLMNGHFLKKE
eukprot:TRINITY_DN613_c0_g1_i1.p1 TRINITY_DN613_c0_g1~~TRINITY_DN613_c0_g1_i1.p1  ORF type:complete len:140 (+),score=27.81 TRINITY_DN613_c0_g1_i1:147-566(+)